MLNRVELAKTRGLYPIFGENMDQTSTITHLVAEEYAGQRLDKALAELFPDYSRSCLQNWLKRGYISIDGRQQPPKHKLKGGEQLVVQIPEVPESPEVSAEDIAVDVKYADEDIVVINKPAGMVVHPAAGNKAGTLQNALLHHFPEVSGVPRGGLVHRLDKDTSGLLVVARSLRAHKSLVEQLQTRSMGREYDAVVQGTLISGGTVDAAIGRHHVDRKRMAVRQGGKLAVTHYRIKEKFRQHTYLQVNLETGRTHQIRVHMAHIKKPIVGDPVYAGRMKVPADCGEELRTCLQHFNRQALHAGRLGLIHPASGEEMQWNTPLPDDMQRLLSLLREDSRESK